MTTNITKKSLVIILHEIYGINDHIQFFRDMMVKTGFDIITPNLLHREPFTYEQEENAYNYFMNEIGFNKSVNEVKQVIDENRKQYNKIYIIGFSIGATIGWMCSEYNIDGIVSYYGSRIRNYMGIAPNCLTLLFFSRFEKSFDVADLVEKLQSKKNVKIELLKAEHGFMNPFYKTYNIDEYNSCLEKSIEFLREIEEDTGIR